MVLIISTIVDIAFAILPYQLNDGVWWNLATAKLVNSGGLLPFVGVTFWLISDWIESVSKDSNGRRGGLSSKVISFSSLALGVIFFLIVPLQVLTNNSERDKTFSVIREGGTTMESQIDRKVKEITGDKAKMQQVQQQLADMDKFIKSGKVQSEDFKKLKEELDALAAGPVKAKDFLMSDLRRKQKDLEGVATLKMWQTGIRTGLASLLLSAGWGFIGLTGLRGQKR
jgi:hypothetical protein